MDACRGSCPGPPPFLWTFPFVAGSLHEILPSSTSTTQTMTCGTAVAHISSANRYWRTSRLRRNCRHLLTPQRRTCCVCRCRNSWHKGRRNVEPAALAAAATAGTRDVATSGKNLIAAAATAGQNDAATPLVQRTKVPEQPPEKDPSGCRQPAISYTVHTKMRQKVVDQSAALQRWLAEEVHDLDPQY